MRIACTLESLLHVSEETRLVVDDYADRDYFQIEQFAHLISLHGIVAEFRKRPDFDERACRSALNAAYFDLR